ncbi:uncharacterized protein LOC142098612 [Mixophyes fleayi]|uniref:uncharacterized protein LOC142098612 n=1 Tax=Mixophyes fleayi TaxID=3061075 RepID=UPI003F4E0AEB
MIALDWAPKSTKMSAALLLTLLFFINTSRGAPDRLVWQSDDLTIERKGSVKLNCSFDESLLKQKPSLRWIKMGRNKRELEIYPNYKYSVRFHVDIEAFKNLEDAGIVMNDLRRQDSGVYICCVTIQDSGVSKECRGKGTYLTIQATNYDRLVACCPLGVFLATLLVLHGLVYKQWVEYEKLESCSGGAEQRSYRIRITRFFSGFTDLFSTF